ncbi:CDP-alcohol phosphatidyltransferase family protein [Thiohalomonas denitrificans]|uniref:CDP-diacylglycerol--glycerol-3-phosphate 3-phosphatidyltransferase n=1 Tax=Thiohalomonas denitrificans TaxID=415747 RepID=A0A1G5QMG1_9GAMM|nr:CDP-alcohol phosphatidyltransferase family protein [Thiohalomonas denitrificans]SCZ62836.1 CDP-diacylglycerol--glycerol-3-phosphate 3-phosphatidyltransferase [Thiohalomonas denitrificans]
MNPKAIPNLITCFRILLVIPLVALLVDRQYGMVLALFAVAGASDALDGFLARRFGWSSRLGALLDPLADKLLMVSSYITMGLLGMLPAWLVALVILRDIVIIGGAAAYQFLIGQVEMEPTLVSKANTALQVLLVLLVLFSFAIQALPGPFINGIVMVVAVTTVWSGFKYVGIWGKRAHHYRSSERKGSR